MDNEAFWTLITKYLSNESSREEENKLMAWINSDPKYRRYFDQAIENWQKAREYTGRNYSKQRGRQLLNEKISYSALVLPKKLRPIYYSIAAAIILLIVSGVIMISDLNFSKPTTVSTKPGERKEIKLPDGSHVWLNAGTSLTFNNEFNQTFRHVSLEGEAYFNVKHNAQRPFIVNSNGLEVQVLGTSFNVSSYQTDGEYEVMVSEGKVRVTPGEDVDSSVELMPGDISKYSIDKNQLSVHKIENIADIGAWRQGKLVFRNSRISEAIKALERKYNVTIKFSNPEIGDCLINGHFKNESIKSIINYICLTISAEFKMLGPKTILIEGPGCEGK